jgi:hypothetical protein
MMLAALAVMPMLRFSSMVVVTFGIIGAARAAPASGAWLAWSPASDACGDAGAFAARVERALGRSPARAAVDAHLNVTARAVSPPAGGARWVGEVHLRGDDQRELGSRTIDRGDTSCQPLVDALAMVTALALADDGLVAPEPTTPSGSGPSEKPSPVFEAPPAAPASPPPAVASPLVPVVAPVVVPVAVQVLAPEPPAAAPREPVPLLPRSEPIIVNARAQAPARAPRRWRSGVDAGPTMGFGLLPRAAFGAEVSAYLSPARGWKLFLVFQGWQRQTVMDQLGRGASLQRLTVGLGVCPLGVSRGPWEGAACLGGGVGRLDLSGVGIPMPSADDRLTLNAGLTFEVTRRLVGPLAAGVTAGVAVPLIRDRVGYSTTDGTVVSLFRESPLAAIVAFRLSFVF